MKSLNQNTYQDKMGNMVIQQDSWGNAVVFVGKGQLMIDG
jgi:hypothetical protein